MPRPRSLTATVSHVRSRGAKPWLVQYRAVDATGTRRRFPEYYATEAEARQRKASIDGAVQRTAAQTTPVTPALVGPVTFRQHYDEWMREVVPRKKPGSQAMYESNLRCHVLDLLGDVLVTDQTLTSREIIQVITKRTAAGLSWAMQQNVLRSIGACLKWAVEWKRLTTNPVAGLSEELRDESYDEPEPNPLTREQVLAFLHWVRTDGRELPAGFRPRQKNAVVKMLRPRSRGYHPKIAHWYPYFLLLYGTGMRRAEGAGLQWPNVLIDDPEETPTILIREGFCQFARRLALEGDKRYKATGLQKPKTKASIRDIDGLMPELVDLLRALAQARRDAAFRQGREPSPFVILGSRGGPVRGRKTVDTVFALGMAAIGATDEGHTVHDLRDTYATLHLIAKPGRLLRISRLLGHRNPNVTLRRYSKHVQQLELADDDYNVTLQRRDYGEGLSPVELRPEMSKQGRTGPEVRDKLLKIAKKK